MFKVSIKCPECNHELYNVNMDLIYKSDDLYLFDTLQELEDELQFDSHDPYVIIINCPHCGYAKEIIDCDPDIPRMR